MNAEQTIISAENASAQRERGWHSQIVDDKAMLRAARDLTKDIAEARAAIYWPDMIGSAIVGYGALAAAILIENATLAVVLGIVSALTLIARYCSSTKFRIFIATRFPASAPAGTCWSAFRC